MIKELYTKPCAGYEANYLIPFPGRELREKLLVFENPAESKVVYSMNIRGGQFLIDFNDQKRISSLELGIYRKRWIVVNNDMSRPVPTTQGCLEFVNLDTSNIEFDELRLRVFTDKPQSAVRIEIGDYDRSNSRWIAISKYCIAELVEDYLVGFWLDISDY